MVLGIVNAQLDELEARGLYSPKWVMKYLTPREPHTNGPDPAGCDRIIAAFKQAVEREMLKNEPPLPPPGGQATPFQILGFHISVDGSGIAGHRRIEGAPDGWSHGDEAFRKRHRWHAHVLPLAEVMQAELSRVNPVSVKIGYSKDGPIVRALAKAIPLITGEYPSRAAIAKHLERH